MMGWLGLKRATHSLGSARCGAALLLVLGTACSAPTSPQESTPSSALRPPTSPQPTPSPSAPAVRYQEKPLPDANAKAYIVVVPAGAQLQVRPVVAPTEATVCQLAQSVQAVAAINAGYFDPQNQQTTSYVTINRQLVADPASNSRLMENPQLQPYLRQILDRSEFRRYDCSTGVAYAIARHSSDVPSGCTLVDAVGAGPELLPEVKARWEGFIDPEVGRDAIGARQPNARSAVGISATGDVMVVMVAQTAPTGGLTLAQLAELLRSLGAQQALNLDGGTSSALVYEGKAMLGKLDESGQTTSRPVKSILAVTAE